MAKLTRINKKCMNKIKMYLRTYGTVSLNHNTWAKETKDPVFKASIINIMGQYEIHETLSNFKDIIMFRNKRLSKH